MMNELDIKCSMRLIEFIEKRLSNGKDLTTVISKLLINLVRRLGYENGRDFTRNGIILATSYLRNPSAYQYNNIGVESKELKLNDKEEMLSLLRAELLPN
ncbi:MAG: hypothetical protein ACFFG0_50480 [Candidatus Thorarchaeota archaeon]